MFFRFSLRSTATPLRDHVHEWFPPDNIDVHYCWHLPTVTISQLGMHLYHLSSHYGSYAASPLLTFTHVATYSHVFFAQLYGVKKTKLSTYCVRRS